MLQQVDQQSTIYDPQFAHLPFFDQTVALFESVKTHDFERLAALCDDDFGIVDLDTDGGSVLIETRPEWEAWFHDLFGRLTAMQADTDTEIVNYQALAEDNLGYSVVNFVQLLTVDGQTARFRCVATIIWKQVDGQWKESRWHCSLLGVEQ